jgi:hypothetical protein
MGTLLDLLSSTIFGGMLLIILLNANEQVVENSSKYSGDELVQEMLVSTARLLEGEFRNIGFGVPENQTTILAADSSSIRFLCDLGRNGGTFDTVRYSLGPISDLAHTMNELDRYLYRSVNGAKPLRVGAVTIFQLNYFDNVGLPLPTPVPALALSQVFVVEVTLEVQNPYAISRQKAMINPGERTALYSASLWQQTRLVSQNFRR